LVQKEVTLYRRIGVALILGEDRAQGFCKGKSEKDSLRTGGKKNYLQKKRDIQLSQGQTPNTRGKRGRPPTRSMEEKKRVRLNLPRGTKKKKNGELGNLCRKGEGEDDPELPRSEKKKGTCLPH